MKMMRNRNIEPKKIIKFLSGISSLAKLSLVAGNAVHWKSQIS